MEALSNTAIIDPIKSYQYSLFLQDRWARQCAHKKVDPLITFPGLKTWSSATSSKLSVVKGSFRSRYQVNEISTSVLGLLHSADASVIWVLKPMRAAEDSQSSTSSIDIIKSLILQTLRTSSSYETEKSMSLSCAQFQTAQTEDQWFALLGSVLARIDSEIFIVVDLDVVDPELAQISAPFSWPRAFLDLFGELSTRGCKIRVKVLLLSRSHLAYQEIDQSDVHNAVVPIKVAKSRPPKRRAGLGSNRSRIVKRRYARDRARAGERS